MLIRLNIKNFLSFKDKISLSMIASDNLTSLYEDDSSYNKSHILSTNKNFNMLRLAAIYGANGSGKTNIIRCIGFIKSLIIGKTLDEIYSDYDNIKISNLDSDDDLSMIEFEICIDDKLYVYGFDFNQNRIVEEWLLHIDNINNTDIIIFNRKYNDITSDVISFENIEIHSNKLALTSFCKNIEYIENDMFKVYNWFSDYLYFSYSSSIYITNSYSSFVIDNNFDKVISSVLPIIDNSIDKIHFRKTKNYLIDISFENINIMQKTFINLIENTQSKFKSNIAMIFFDEKNNKFYKMCQINNDGFIDFEILELFIVRKEHYFSISFESDGIKQILKDIFNIMIYKIKDNSVVFIDNFLQGLHPNIVRGIINNILLSSNNKSQIIFTTHNTNLLRGVILRRDEIYFIDKNWNLNNSELYSLSDYKFKGDDKKEIYGYHNEQNYLNGRFNSVPHIPYMDKEEINKIFDIMV